jgi:hypothetical protein
MSSGCGGGPQVPADPAAGRSVFRFRESSRAAGLAGGGPSYAAAAADFDRDGRPDVAVSQHGSIALYRNRGDGSFEALSDWAGLEPADTHGLSWVDLDHDGWLDLYVSIGAARGYGRGPNQLYRNLRTGRLELDPSPSPVLADPRGRGRCSCPADVDGDGVVDLAILNASESDRPHRLAASRGPSWADVAEAVGLTEVDAECLSVAAAGPSGTPLWVAYGVGSHSGSLFARNDSGVLEDVTERLGVSPGPPNVMSAVWGDVDSDGDLDLYLVAGLGVPREVAAGDGRIDFRLLAREPGEWPGFRFRAAGELELDVLVAGNRRPARVRLGRNGSPVDRLRWLGSPDDPALEGAPVLSRDAEIGVYLWRQGDELVLRFVGDGGRFRAASGRVSAAEEVALVEELQDPARADETPNRLLINDGGAFVDGTERAGVGDPSSGRDAAFADLDNDGDLDLWVVNGGTAFANQPDVLYRNDGIGVFTDITAEAGVSGPSEGRGASALVFDADSDGDLDLFSTNGDGPPPGNDGPWQLWRNDSSVGHRVTVELEGGPGNAAAMGALVTARFGGRVLALTRSATTSRFATGVLPLHIGIGEAERVEVEVMWPTGATDRVTARAGERVVLREPSLRNAAP